jgi:hypothetical protein
LPEKFSQAGKDELHAGDCGMGIGGEQEIFAFLGA